MDRLRVENQAVCQWGFRRGDHDPEVFVDDRNGWRPVGCRLDAFLSGAAVEEAALGWAHEAGMIHHHGSGILSLTTQVQDDLGFLFLAAQTTAALVAVEARLEVDSGCEITERWDYSQR